MTNNIRKIKQDLRAYAKRCKDVHYTESLLITFLVTGMLFTTSNLFSAPTNTSIENQRQTISTSIKTIHQQVKVTRKENDKLLKNTNLELIRLMEQGDHVVKSPWSSWQYGINYFNNNWNGTYKGRGDKQEKYPYEGIFQRSLNSFERYTSPESKNYGLLSKSTNPYSALTSNRSGVLGYGIASTTPKQEPLTVMNVDASIRPKDVYRDPVTAPTVNVSAPVLQALNVPNLLPPSLDIKTPDAVTAPNKAPTINVNPTIEFKFDGHNITNTSPTADYKNQDGKGLTYWSGWNPGNNSLDNRSVWYRTGNTLGPIQNRKFNLIYANAKDRPRDHIEKWILKNATLHVAGDPSWSPKGTSAIHAVWDGDIIDVKGRLHGYSTFIAAETWHSGNINISGNSEVTVENSNNSIFFGYPGSYYTIGVDNVDYHSYNQRGGYTGNLKVNINAGGNYVYSIMGVQGSFKLNNSGDYNLKGNGNMVYLGMGYSPNFQNLKDSGDVTNNASTAMTPFMKLGTDAKININGNSNVGLYFSDRYKNFTLGGNLPYDTDANFTANDWAKSVIGIYQGEIEVGMNIGETSLSKNNVGVYSKSGQREGINPENDLGAPNATARSNGAARATADGATRLPGHVSHGQPEYNKDKIHNLEIGATKIYFGKNAVDSIMFAAARGTIMDVARPDKADKNLGRESYKEIGAAVAAQTEIRDAATDVISSYDDTANQAATGTVIAYSTGVWDHSADMPSAGGTLANKPTEINLYKPVVMTGRAKMDSGKLNRSVALIGDNKGVVNAKDKVTALGYSSIVALAQNNGVVNAERDIVAKDGGAATDAATKPYLYNNIGAYAGANGEVNVAGNADIYGIGAMASGASAKANLNGTGNTIRSGKSGALVATNGGRVNFGGGTITHSENFSGDHDSSTPFNADSSSHINFTGATTLNISHGVLIPGTATDYAAATGTTTKYNGMSNVTVNLTGDNVVLASNNGIHKIWDGTTIANLVKSTMKVAAFNDNKHSYKIYYINGQFDIDSNIDVGNASDDFNKVGLSREVVTINAGKTVSSTVGKGLAMGSNDSANADGNNAKTQFINNGTVDIKGGSLSAGTIGLNISYGQIHNKNIVNVENGIGAYGINGSTLTNDTTGKINITTQGVGMAAFTSASSLQSYGTDKKINDGTLTAADKTFEIINKGQVTVNGNKSVGLYGDTNGSSSKLSAVNGVITNSGKITLTGNESVGIVSKRATVNLNGIGSSDIVVGKKGIGVYAEKSPVNINSNYGIEVKDGGTGVFIKNDGSSLSSGSNTFELKYSGSNTGTGVGLFYEGGTGANIVNGTNVKLTDSVGTTAGLVGLYTAGGGKLTNNAKITGDKGYGIISNGAEVENAGNITLTNPLTSSKPSVGILTQAGNKITNTGTVTVGNNSVGIFGKEIVQKGIVTVGNGGTGLYSEGGNVTLDSTSKINTGSDKAVGVFTKGTGQTITANAGSTMSIGDSSFGFLNEGKGNTINSNVANQTLRNDGTYIYSSDRTGVVNNNTKLTSTGSYNYGLYSAGTVTNNADINFGNGLGNVGIYSTYGGSATNLAGRNITVGASYKDPTDPLKDRYAVGMAAGFNGDGNPAKAYTGNIVNEGTINVNGKYSIGMYGTEAGTKVYNGTAPGSSATINLGASNTTGMYLDNGAYGYNYGTIKSTGTGLSKVVGIVVKNGSTIENHGKIEITAEDGVGILSKGNAAGANPGIIKNYGTFNINGVTDPTNSSVIKKDSGGQDLGKSMGRVKIDVPAGSTTGTITVNGKPVVPTLATTTAEEYKDMQLSKIGMYIDTSNKRFTNPINGLSALSGLKTADLIMGNEAAQNTTSKYIQVAQKILEPYNEMIKKNPQIKKWNIYAGSLTWMATVSQNQTDGTMQNAYLAKIPYTHWAGNQSTPVDKKDTYNFTDGLEQRYGVEKLGSRENQVFQKLNGIGKNEQILLFQAFDEMMGHQYGNLQQRINATGNLLDKEFRYLKHDWRNPSKQNNKIKVFGMRDEYNTDTAGIINYTSNAYGVAYVHEDEKIKMGNSSGWYAGAVTNRFKFKDIGKSKENQTILKAGVFKTMSPKKDYNGALQWTIGGDVFVGINDMKRRYLVVDDVFQAKSDYHSYGAALKTDLGYDVRLSERTHFRPYGALKMEYGRFNDIKEDRGEMRLEVKGNDYFSVKPEVGMEFKYVQPLAVRTNLTVGLTAAYENELGKVGDVNNRGRVRYTTADWFGIRGEKDDRKGNGKFDLNIGVDNTRFGVTVNGGYDTKGKNVRAGIGFRAIY
ncbi:autotransporter-associated N-terminal domain-containing protein [Leptotrichia trevisanii]|uniref:Fusobacterium outer membrane protein n=1 Tax=Leptotrichia trevisanii TaxID=109328 RepID=A0A510K192_9FUSO|nr:autotransporter-associated N-terminal domain-containing protein [Leptotrichia trevisanii]BBM45366.1 fusobacterium outer membrane protein [Leptotrichia trevisanii]